LYPFAAASSSADSSTTSFPEASVIVSSSILTGVSTAGAALETTESVLQQLKSLFGVCVNNCVS
jgi:hypothetical protein